MRPQMDHSLYIEFEELFALKERLGAVADQARARLAAGGLQERFETELFDHELELRGSENSKLLIRLDSYRLELTGASADFPAHLVAAILLDEAGAFRLTTIEAGYNLTFKVRRGQSLDLVHRAFSPMAGDGAGQMLDRRFSMTWEWGDATTGYSFQATDTEDRELALTFRAREGYLTQPDLQAGAWSLLQARVFDGAVQRFLTQLGWSDQGN